MQEQLDLFCEQNHIYSFEGETGVENMVKIARALGYDRSYYVPDPIILFDFLADNSGMMEAMYAWLSETNVPEWRIKIEALNAGGEQ